MTGIPHSPDQVDAPAPAETETCDHEWRIRDDSFGHEFGTEIVVCWECDKCGEQKPYSSRDDGGPREDGE
jgi:hypothetical protein